MKNNNYKKYIYYLILSLILTTIGTFIGGYLSIEDIAVYSIFSIILLLFFLFSKGRLKRVLFYLFLIGEGITLTPILANYTVISIFGCLLITTLVVIIFAIIGLKVRDLGFLGGILSVCLISLIVYNLINIFIPLPSIALLGVIIFCAYVSYDINCFKNDAKFGDLSDEEILDSVMNMYLDILNLFIQILKAFGDSDD